MRFQRLVILAALYAIAPLSARAQDCENTPRGCATLRELVAQLRSSDPHDRSDAAYRLGFAGDSARPFIPLLTRQANADKNRSARLVAIEALGYVGPDAVPALASLLRIRDDTLAARAAELLSTATPSPELLAALIETLDHRRGIVGTAAAYTLAGFGPSVDSLLRSRLASRHPWTRESAARGLKYLNVAASNPAAGRCYHLDRGPYTPPLAVGEDSVFSTMPSYLYLSTRRYTDFWDPERFAFRAEPTLSSGKPSRFVGAWFPRGDTVHVQFGMLSGITLTLQARGDSLGGTVRTFWDFPRSEQQAAVSGMAVPCR